MTKARNRSAGPAKGSGTTATSTGRGGRHGFFEEFAADVVPLVRSFL